MRRRTLATLLIGAITLSSASGWLAARSIKSPGEVAARTAAPAPSPILVPVEERVLTTDIVSRGTARFGSAQQLNLAPSALQPTINVVDSLPLTGAELKEGELVLTASGRPVFLLVGDQPSFRDLGPGLEGTDVLQLEQALERLGFAPGPADGVYDAKTEAAVRSWYEAAGKAPMEATETQLAAIRALETDLAAARIDVLAAQDTVVAGERDLAAARATVDATNAVGANSTGIAAARAEAVAANTAAAAEVTARQLALDEIRRGQAPVSAPSAEIARAEADLEVARAAVATVATVGTRVVAEARDNLERAPADLAAAKAEAAANDLVAESAVTSAQTALTAGRADPSTTPAQLASLQSDLSAAQASRDSIKLAGQQSVAAAQRSLDGAPAALAAAQQEAASNDRSAAAEVAAKQAALDSARSGGPTVPGAPAAVAAAEAELRTAEANAVSVRLAGERAVTEAEAIVARANGELIGQQAAVTAAEQSLELARQAVALRDRPANLAELNLGLSKRRAGVQVPANEIIFVPSAPVRVSELQTARGKDALGPVVSVTDATVYIDASLALDQAPLVTVGTEVAVDELDLGIKTVGTVSFVAAGPGTNGVDGFHIYVQILVAEPPPNLVGASVRLTIAAESSGLPVLAVPISAVTLTADGASAVEIHDGDAVKVSTVEPGLSAGGFVQITPTSDTIKAGDLVLVGFEQAASPGG